MSDGRSTAAALGPKCQQAAGASGAPAARGFRSVRARSSGPVTCWQTTATASDSATLSRRAGSSESAAHTTTGAQRGDALGGARLVVDDDLPLLDQPTS